MPIDLTLSHRVLFQMQYLNYLSKTKVLEVIERALPGAQRKERVEARSFQDMYLNSQA